MAKRSLLVAGAVSCAATVGFAVPVLAATSYPNDYFFAAGDQWALTGSNASINAPAAWCRSTGAGIVVADVDTGANFSHPDLQGKLIAGAAFLGGNTTESQPSGTGVAAVSDDFGHGSMTTGIMVADTNNGQGIAGVAPDARALIVKVLRWDPQAQTDDGYPSDIGNGIRWAVDYGHANVINLSIGPGSIVGTALSATGDPITSAIQYAVSKGVAVALAAGNSGIPAADYVTLEQHAIVVGALGPNDTMASYSNYGYNVSIYAPGGDSPSQSQQTLQNEIVSTYVESGGGADYAIGEGTSFATPQVAGVLADLMATGMSASQATSAVASHTSASADNPPLPQLDAAAALGTSKSALCGTQGSAPTGPPPVLTTTHTTTTSYRTTYTTRTTYRTTTQQQTQRAQTTTTTTATSSTPPPQPGVVQTPADAPGRGGRALPPATTTGTGVPAPLIAGGLIVLIAGGAPVGTRLLRRWRTRRT